MELNNKNVLITGGAHRLGKIIALSLAKKGANIIIHYNSSSSKAQETKNEICALGVKSVAIKADLSDPNQVKSMVDQGKNEIGYIDILINNASHFQITPFPTNDYSAWHQVINILINGPYYCSNNIAPMMLEKGEGSIINIVDLSAWNPWPDRGAHSVGKAALLALTKQLALELAPSIRVNAIAPGPVIPSPHFDQNQIERLARKNLLNRWGSGEDIVKAVNYLLDSDFVTGEVLVVDGGEQYGHLRYRFKDENSD